MIASNIDGSNSGGTGQLLDLLALVANPEAYSQKVKELEELIAQNKQFVELVGPASDIIRLREEARADRADAAAYVLAAKQEAKDIKAKAAAEAAKVAKDKEAVFSEKAEAIAAKMHEADARMAAAEAKLKKAGAHHVVRSVAELPAVLAKIAADMRAG